LADFSAKAILCRTSAPRASQKVSESYQRITATIMKDKELAVLFYQTHDPADAQRRAVWGLALNTLQHEYRFAKQGLHPTKNDI
jgi:hypothetical protein